MIVNGGPQGANIIVMGASIDWGGRYDVADHDVRDWPTIVIGQCADAPGQRLYAPCTRLNLAVSGATDFQVGNIPFQADHSHTVAVFGAIWANNISLDESAADCYALLVARVADVRALGVSRIVIATGYLLAGESAPQQAAFTALNALIRADKGGYSGATVAELSAFPVGDAVYAPDGGHPSCPGSAVNPGPGQTYLADHFAPALLSVL